MDSCFLAEQLVVRLKFTQLQGGLSSISVRDDKVEDIRAIRH